MKEIIKVTVEVIREEFTKVKTELLCVGIFSKQQKLDKICSSLDKKLAGAIERIIELGDFKGEPGTTALLYSDRAIGAKRLLLVGLGDKNKATIDTVRNAAALAANKAVALKVKTVAVALQKAFGGKFDQSIMAQAIAEGIYFGSYRYDEFVTKSENGRQENLKAIMIEPESAKKAKIAKAVEAGAIIGQAQSFARTLVNRPANVMYPAKLAEIAKKIASQTTGLTCTVFDDKLLKQKNMGGIIAVGQGSSNKPRMIVLKYSPRTKPKSKAGTVALVGKAITFDSGGISIKPSSNMDAMKMDMSGGAAVLAAMKAIAELKVPVNVIAVICAAENKPGSDSYRPGDIITTYSGKTVEVLNTDAEGRLVLCDGIHYATELNCDVIIDIATLTAACMVALGSYKAGLMGNAPKLLKALELAAKESGESVWQMPCGDEYLEEMKSKIADLKNTGSRWGGACTAASFLAEFAGDKNWAHLDIAGTMEASEPAKKLTCPGSIGFGVRLLTSYVRNLATK